MPSAPHAPRAARSRRDLFALAGLSAAGGSIALLAACGSGDSRDAGNRSDSAEGKRENAEKDASLLNAALDLEHAAVASYTLAARLLRGEGRTLGRDLLDHEREHADSLAQTVLDLGGRPHAARRREDYEADLPPLRSEDDALRFAVDLEETAVAAYAEAIPKLSSGQLRATAASIITVEAGHLSALLAVLGRPPAPGAFVAGAP